jgi:hypothetical protein
MGILSAFGYDPDAQGSGILGAIAGGLRDNSGALMGYGTGGAAGLEAGMKQDTVASAQRYKRQQDIAEKQAMQKLGKLMGAPDGLDGESLKVWIQDKHFKQSQANSNRPGFEERQFNALSPEQQTAYRQKHFLGESDVLTPFNYKDKEAGTERTMFRRGNQILTPEQAGVQQSTVPNKADEAAASTAGTVIENVDRALDLKKNGTGTSGFWAPIMKGAGGSPANDLYTTVDTIKANVSFDTLSAMRKNSPTGGALGAVSDTELRLLAATAGSLDPSQSTPQFERNLNNVRKMYSKVLRKMGYDDSGKPIGGGKTSTGLNWSYE